MRLCSRSRFIRNVQIWPRAVRCLTTLIMSILKGAIVTDTLINWMITSIVGWNAATAQLDSITDVSVIMKDRTGTWTNTETYEWAYGLPVSDVRQADLEEKIARLCFFARSYSIVE